MFIQVLNKELGRTYQVPAIVPMTKDPAEKEGIPLAALSSFFQIVSSKD